MKIMNSLILVCLVAVNMLVLNISSNYQYFDTTKRNMLSQTEVHPPRSAQVPPLDVAHRFLDRESTSMPDQWKVLSSFFVDAPKPDWNKVHVVDIVDVGIDVEGDASDVSISTNWLGDLNLSLQLSSYPSRRLPLIIPSASACYGDHYFGFDLVLSDNQQDRSGNELVQQSKEQQAWKIKESSFEPVITLDTAIRYVKEFGGKTTERAKKRNASRTLGILNYFHNHPGKPLPSKLASGAGGTCG